MQWRTACVAELRIRRVDAVAERALDRTHERALKPVLPLLVVWTMLRQKQHPPRMRATVARRAVAAPSGEAVSSILDTSLPRLARRGREATPAPALTPSPKAVCWRSGRLPQGRQASPRR
jgi:hypothetical protein